MEDMSYINSRSIALARFTSAAMLDRPRQLRRHDMSATQRPAGSAADDDESLDDHVSPTPDEDGPHDVPDDTVIESTLPTKPMPDRGRRSQR